MATYTPIFHLADDETKTQMFCSPYGEKLVYFVSEIPENRSLVRVYSPETKKDITCVVIDYTDIVYINFLPESHYSYIVTCEKGHRRNNITYYYFDLKTFTSKYHFNISDDSHIEVSPCGKYYVHFDETFYYVKNVSDNSLITRENGNYISDIHWKYDSSALLINEDNTIRTFSMTDFTCPQHPINSLLETYERQVNIQVHPTLDCIVFNTLKFVKTDEEGSFLSCPKIVATKWNGELLFTHILPNDYDYTYCNVDFKENLVMIEWCDIENREVSTLDIYDCSTGEPVCCGLEGLSPLWYHIRVGKNYILRDYHKDKEPQSISFWDVSDPNPLEWHKVKTFTGKTKSWFTHSNTKFVETSDGFMVLFINPETKTIDYLT
jgi:hypothetical protein